MQKRIVTKWNVWSSSRHILIMRDDSKLCYPPSHLSANFSKLPVCFASILTQNIQQTNRYKYEQDINIRAASRGWQFSSECSICTILCEAVCYLFYNTENLTTNVKKKHVYVDNNKTTGNPVWFESRLITKLKTISYHAIVI